MVFIQKEYHLFHIFEKGKVCLKKAAAARPEEVKCVTDFFFLEFRKTRPI